MLEIELESSNEKIQQYIEKANRFSNEGDMKDGIQFLRNALREYPNNHKLLSILIDFLFGYWCFCGEKEFLDEVIEKSELLLCDCTDNEIRMNVLQNLAFAYNNAENQDKAIETANRLPEYVPNRNQVLSNIIMPMSERRKKKQECIFEKSECMLCDILWMGGFAVGKKDYDLAINYYSCAATIVEQLGAEGFFLLRAAAAYGGLSMAYSGKENSDKAYEYIEKLIATYKSFEDLLVSGDTPYRSPMFDRLTFSKNSIHSNSEEGEYSGWYHNLKETYDCYQTVRDDSRFPALCEQIENDLKYYKKAKNNQQ
ncbi:MAG: hypothetical protein RSA97_07025 [Oscillospiraceae bacterium]